MVQNNSWAKMSSVTYPLQQFSSLVMSGALEEYDGKISIASNNITNLRCVDDIDAPAEEEQELEAQEMHKV